MASFVSSSSTRPSPPEAGGSAATPARAAAAPFRMFTRDSGLVDRRVSRTALIPLAGKHAGALAKVNRTMWRLVKQVIYEVPKPLSCCKNSTELLELLTRRVQNDLYIAGSAHPLTQQYLEYPDILEKATELDFSEEPNLTDAQLINLIRRCPNLQRINLNRCQKITDDAIAALARS